MATGPTSCRPAGAWGFSFAGRATNMPPRWGWKPERQFVLSNDSAEAGRARDEPLEPRRSLGLASSRWFGAASAKLPSMQAARALKVTSFKPRSWYRNSLPCGVIAVDASGPPLTDQRPAAVLADKTG